MNDELIDETESKYTYTKIKPTTGILVMGRISQINVNYNDLVHCIQYNIMFFCEKMFLTKDWEMNTLVKVLSTLIKIQNSFNRNVILNTILT